MGVAFVSCSVGISPLPLLDRRTSHPHSLSSIVFICVRAQFVKVGFAAENFPKCIFPSLVGRPILRAEEAVQKDILLKVR